MPEIPYLHDIVILFGSALVVISISHRFRIPTVVGFLLTGIIVGPHGIGLIKDAHHVEVFAELGVVFLLFVIGLELSLSQLRKLRRIMLLGGTVQVAGTIFVTAGITSIFGYALSQSMYFGFLIALSSSAIVLKLYSERRELSTPQGKLSTGILLYQDVMIVPMLLLVPVLAGTVDASSNEIIIRFGGGLVVVALAFILGHYIIAYLLRVVMLTGVRELFVILVLFTCIGSALLTETLGFSLALGAFLAGILISESDYRYQLLAEITPFRDVFNSMFFISIGMLLNLNFAVTHVIVIGVLVIAIIVIKGFIVFISSALLSFPRRICILSAVGLAHVGEFSFVLIRSGKVHGLLDHYHYQLAIASAVTTMIATPFLVNLSSKLIFGKEGDVDTIPSQTDAVALKNHVVVFGYGLNGRHLARVLRAAHISYVIVELDVGKVEQAKQNEDPVIYGDATRVDILHECGISTAAVAILSYADPLALRQSISLTRQLNNDIFIVVRAQYLAEIEELQKCGADKVVAQEFETSIEIVTMVLGRLHVPRNIIRTQAKLLREDGYEMLRSPAPVEGISEKVMLALAEGTTETYLLGPGHEVVGKSIVELALRKDTGTSIIAVVKGNKSFPNPAIDYVFESGDVLVLVGTHAQIEKAFMFLDEGSSKNEV